MVGEADQLKVTRWTWGGGNEVTVGEQKLNKRVAIADGERVALVTLFEEFRESLQVRYFSCFFFR